MGYLRPTAIIVSASYNFDEQDHWIDVAHRQACKIYGKYDLRHLVSPVIFAGTNNVASFLCAWDGSKEEWETSDQGDLAQADFVKWLKGKRYSDGSSPFKWVQLIYADEENPTCQILAFS